MLSITHRNPFVFVKRLGVPTQSRPHPINPLSFRRYTTEFTDVNVKEARLSDNIGKKVNIKGWVRTARLQKNIGFLEVNDGSCLKNIQLIIPPNLVEQISYGSSISAKGTIIKSPAKGQATEITIDENDPDALKVVGNCPPSYPLQKKGASPEFLRDIAHLRPRTNTTSAMMRIRNAATMAVNEYFQDQGFIIVHTPILTGSDCEGAGEQFQVIETLKPNETITKEKFDSLSTGFFGSKTFLTVSGQLEAEIFATSLSKVYTFGPTFRAEASKTTRHLSEFWMVEMEQANATLTQLKQHGEGLIKHCIKRVLERCQDDVNLFASFVDKGLEDRLKNTLEKPFNSITYTQAVEMLIKSKKKFQFPVEWGANLQSEHEIFLCNELGGPTFVTNYPRSIKPFYARVDQVDDPSRQTVSAVDLLVPKLGEMIGGSEREEREEVLKENMELVGLDSKNYEWYMDLRKYGSVPHGGFGLGFERLILYLTGIDNIRDAIPLPRAYGQCKY
ncbi:asparaginyl tRS [Acrasis kona]|uniref:asparagine--tRNA ligase n=1 Tax=Acrasis kona TaxID=1008807 RepID=A0AAW2YW48_9EUKA